MNCEHQCYCRYGVCIKSTGICPSNRCQRRWKGDTCSEGKLHISILFKIISSGEMTITSIYTQIKELSTRPLPPDILNWNVLLSVLIQMQIFILIKTCVPMKRCDHTGVTVKYDIEIQCTWTISPMHYPKISMFTLHIWVFKSSVFRRKKCILCEHSTEENIGGANMANNRHATNMNFIQSYWTSDGLLLYNSQLACEKTHPNQHH